MKIFDFNEKYQEKELKVIALGFFDSVHIGHIALIEKAKEVAKIKGICSAIFTFKNDMSKVVKRSNGLIFTYYERLKKFKNLHIQSVIFANFTKEFSNLSPEEFIKILTTEFCVKAIVCGKDYKFGKGGHGNVEVLKSICHNYGVEVFVQEEVKKSEERVSTSIIKSLLGTGKIKEANSLLGSPYFISGKVVKDRQVGKDLGFPTANVKIDGEKAPLKIGVYKTSVVLDEKKYSCITNYGARPTFSLDEVLTETYIDGFSGDLYGKEITVYFEEYLRDCVKFDSVNKLIKQLEKDLEKIR